MSRPGPSYANVAPQPRDRERNLPSNEPCKCTICHDGESCSSDYLRAISDEKPPRPCPRFTNKFSPEKSFSDSAVPCKTPKHDTKTMRILDIPLPLPTKQSKNNSSDSSARLVKTAHNIPTHRKPSDVLPVPNDRVSTQPLIPDHRINHTCSIGKDKNQDELSGFEITLPRRKSDLRKKKKQEPMKVHLWMKIGTIVLSLLFIGLLYLVTNRVREVFFVLHQHERQIQHIWNFSEPEESKLDTTVCFPCDLTQEFRSETLKQKEFEMYGFKTAEKHHCCMDQLGHTKWMINMMSANEILEHTSKQNKHVCSVKSTQVNIQSQCSVNGTAILQMNNTHFKKSCKGAGIEVAKNFLQANETGLYIVYMTMTVTLNPEMSTCKSNRNTGNKEIKAHLHCAKSRRPKCIEMETVSTTRITADSYHVFNFFTLKHLQAGEKFFPQLSHPSLLYSMKYGNYIGVVQV
ncbi:uncharacterized protein LOC132549266 [Ylistrum balloti]|uniref:uncharacterized protein LOC132549266 n=1 Tax=Ylistrum balloti TaxID=509963 RepID=UPI002905BF1A|nr:uncharacterized protein LOC132549266 [Ylistrum balloti]